MQQIPELADRGRRRIGLFLAFLDTHLPEGGFVATDEFSVADITAFVAIDFSSRIGIEIPENCERLRTWFDAVKERPSALA